MTTSFASLVTDTMYLTNRPDLVNETALAVKAATLKAHQSDDYIKDFKEYSLMFDDSAYYQTLDYKAILPLWRKPRYIRKYDATNSAYGIFLEYVEPEKVIDEYKVDRTDIFYVAGANVQIKSSTLLQYVLAGIYENPTVTSNGFNSWIADDHPFAIVYEAAAIIFKTIGRDDQVPVYRGMAGEQLQMLKMHAITGVGY